jgi:hypothetical protein
MPRATPVRRRSIRRAESASDRRGPRSSRRCARSPYAPSGPPPPAAYCRSRTPRYPSRPPAPCRRHSTARLTRRFSRSRSRSPPCWCPIRRSVRAGRRAGRSSWRRLRGGSAPRSAAHHHSRHRRATPASGAPSGTCAGRAGESLRPAERSSPRSSACGRGSSDFRTPQGLDRRWRTASGRRFLVGGR